MLRAVFLDLDYTLYDQRQFLLGAFRDVAWRVAEECQRPAAPLEASLRALWEREGTDCPLLFNRWLEGEALCDPQLIPICVEKFHAHAPAKMKLYPGARRTLRRLRERYHTGIITDGHGGMQRNKLRALGLDGSVDRIVLPSEQGMRKPDPRMFSQVLREARLQPREAMFVGDHPVKDIMAARQAGLPAVRVLTGEFASLPDHPEYPPTHTVASVSELLAVIRDRAAGQRVA